jgi:hypothetical protein
MEKNPNEKTFHYSSNYHPFIEAARFGQPLFLSKGGPSLPGLKGNFA